MRRLGMTMALLLALAGCDDDGDPMTDAGPGEDAGPVVDEDAGPGDESTTFTVRIENTSPAAQYTGSGVFNTPEGAGAPGPIGPGGAYEFTFLAGPGMRLSFATMFVPSNDFFYGPDGAGIALFDDMGMPVSGDVTAQVQLWDAGSEENQEPGVGADQVQRQSGPDTGAADPDDTVRLAPDTFSNLPAVADVIQVTLTPTMMNGAYQFTARIENVSTATTLSTSTGDQPVPMSPGVYVVHNGDDPLFEVGMADRGEGLAAIAEDGAAGDLGMAVDGRTFLTVVGSPGVWAVTESGTDLFTVGMADRGQGLEAIAEDGTPTTLAGALAGLMLPGTGFFAVPEGASDPGPILPGGAYEFTIEASPGQRLHTIWMFVPSNDWLFSFPAEGIELFGSDGSPISGDVADQLVLLDLGTEVDQPVGFGLDQVQNQADANTGDADPDTNVRVIDDPSLPAITDVVSITLTPN